MKPLLSIGLALYALSLMGCSTTEPPPDRSAMLRDEDRVSTIPGNRPQGWETTAGLGPLANNPRFGGGSGYR